MVQPFKIWSFSKRSLDMTPARRCGETFEARTYSELRIELARNQKRHDHQSVHHIWYLTDWVIDQWLDKSSLIQREKLTDLVRQEELLAEIKYIVKYVWDKVIRCSVERNVTDFISEYDRY